MPVPLFDPKTQLVPLREEIATAISGVLDDARFILGPNVDAFEQEFAAYLGCAHAIGVANGTEAITIALRALGVGPGDEVIVPSFTFYASAEAIPPTGATPVFCDVDPETFLVTPESVRAVMTPRTKAVIAVHLFGNVAPIKAIRELGVPVIEDSAQAAGSTGLDGRPGTLGDLATFSFYPSKNLGAFGDGGAITTNDAELDANVRSLRFHGSRDKVTYEQVGYNSRLDEIQAAILRVQLPALNGWAARRNEAAGWYADAGLAEFAALPVASAGAVPAWHLYVIRCEHPDALQAELAKAGVESRGYYRTPVHRQEAMREWGAAAELPVTDELARTHLAIPISASIARVQVDEVVAAVHGAQVTSV